MVTGILSYVFALLYWISWSQDGQFWMLNTLYKYAPKTLWIRTDGDHDYLSTIGFM